MPGGSATLTSYDDTLRQWMESLPTTARAESERLLAVVVGETSADAWAAAVAVEQHADLLEHRLAEQLDTLQASRATIARGFASALPDDPSIQLVAERALNDAVGECSLALSRVARATGAEHAEHWRTEKTMRQLRSLQGINAVANSATHVDQTLTTTARIVAEELGVDLCAIFLFDETTRELLLRATNDPHPRAGPNFSQHLGQGYTGWVAEHGQPLQVFDALVDERFRDEASAYPTPYRGLLAMPIIFFTVEKLQGVICVQSAEPRAFAEDEIIFLEIVAGQIAMSTETGKLFAQTDEELRRKIHEMSTLHRVSALVASTLVLDNVLRIIVAQAVLLSGAERSVLFELEPTTQRLRVAASHGFESAEVQRAVVRVGECCAGRAVQTGERTMHIDCMRTDVGCFLHTLPEVIGDQHAALCVPLATMRGPLGALCVFSSQRYLLSPHQSQLVTTFANVAAIAMENARLFEQTREGLHTKEALLREMHHRVKNNLQQVASILNMQGRSANSPEVKQILVESVDRIQSIAATHDLLSSTQLGRARADDIARKIVGISQGNLLPPDLHVRFTVGAAAIDLPSEQATTFAIVLHELIANAIEHGFADRTRGEMRISFARRADQVVVRVADDGRGVANDFSVSTADGLGLRLVRELVESDLRGRITIFAMRGSPDLTPNDSMSDDATTGAWTIAELRFPAVLTDNATDEADEMTGDLIANVPGWLGDAD